MSRSRTRRSRKVRRKVRAVLKHGPDARPIHKARSGRTGKVFAKQLKSRG